MNGFVLKMIAIIAMFIDHFTAILVPGDSDFYMIGRGIGRVAFPIFCFLLVEGFIHTSNVKKYLLRLGAFALISEVPFDIAFGNKTSQFGFLQQQNVFFTLFIGLVVIYLMSIIEKKYEKNIILSNILDGAVVVAGSAVATFLLTDYIYLGIILIVSFYLFREHKFVLFFAVYAVTALLGGTFEGLATISMAFIVLYNGQRGPKFNKYIFYGFYPVHILCIYLIKILPIF